MKIDYSLPSWRHIAAVGAVLAVALGLVFALGAVQVGAHIDPEGCTDTGGGVSIAAFRSDGITNIGVSNVTDGEQIKYRATLSALDLPNCAFEGGTWELETPDGVIHDLGAVPQIGGEGVASHSSSMIDYTVSHADEVSSVITATTNYSGGTSHADEQDTTPGPVLGTSKLLTVIHPSTIATITASSSEILEGDDVTLTITEENDGDVDLVNPFVEVSPLGLILDENSAEFVGGDTGGDGVLGVGETWTWEVVDAPTGGITYVATGHGVDPLDNDITFPDDQDEQDEVRVLVFELGSVSGNKFHDLDGDGSAQEDGEPNLEGWTMRLYEDSTDPWVLIGTDITDESGEYSFADLEPGSYKVCEVLEEGWTQTFPDNNANNNSPSSSEEGPVCQTVNIDTSGETNTRNFGNMEERGNIIIEKQTDPDGDQTVFTFNPSYGEGSFDLSDGQQNDSGPLAPSVYSVDEVVPDGWELTGVVCSDQSDPSAIEFSGGETVTCVFTNTKLGTITIVKDAQPDDAQDVNFTEVGLGDGSFILDDDGGEDGTFSESITFTNLALNAEGYPVNEDVPEGWELTDITCVETGTETLHGVQALDDGVAIPIAPGDDVTCTFTNEITTGTIIVDKVTDPEGDPTEFEFDPSWGDSFVLADQDAPHNSGGLVPDTYSVSEVNIPDGWTPSDVTCDDDDGDDNTNIQLDPGETVTCTFTNTAEPGEIHGFKWHDESQDGVFDEGDEPLLNGWTIELYQGEQLIDSMVTMIDNDETEEDETGMYWFMDLEPGTYTVCEVLQGGWFQTFPEGGECHTVELGAGEIAEDTSFGNDQFEGCTPGYWKQDQHFGNWTSPYDPDDLFVDIFGEDPGEIGNGKKTTSDPALLDALNANGGGINALLRHATAALLNVASEGVVYDDQWETPNDVIDAFAEIFPEGSKQDYNQLAGEFGAANEAVGDCPLGRAELQPE